MFRGTLKVASCVRGIIYHQQLFQMFYSRMRLPAGPEPDFPRGKLIREIDYSVSLDGKTWLKLSSNPVRVHAKGEWRKKLTATVRR